MAREQSNSVAMSVRHIFDLAAQLTAVKRDILLSPTHWENDSEHTLVTALITWQIARKFAPEMNATEILAMGLVHELAETITGDTSSFGLSEAELRAKKERDAAAVQEFATKFRDCPRLVAKFLEYEDKVSAEARFVYWIDKIMPMFSKYGAADAAHWSAPFDEIYEVDGVKQHGLNGNRETVQAWYGKTRRKLLSVGEAPHPICEELLRQNFIWLNWLVDSRQPV